MRVNDLLELPIVLSLGLLVPRISSVDLAKLQKDTYIGEIVKSGRNVATFATDVLVFSLLSSSVFSIIII